MRTNVDLRTFVGSVPLPTPVLTASGTAGHGAELASYVDLSTLGAVVVKSLSAHPWPGNRPPRVHETPAGMLNSVGLQGPGVAAWVAHELPLLNDRGARVVASIWGRTAQEYARAASMLAGAPGVIAVEVNVSCPNIEDRDRMFAHSAHATAQAVEASAPCELPLWVKLSPNTPDIVDIAEAALEAGAETLVLVNTVLGMAIDTKSRTYRLGSAAGGGGLSGPAIRPVAVRAVHDCRAAFPRVGIVGVGGVSRGVDVVEMMLAGADAVEVGTATFRDPRAPARVLSGLRRWCRIHDVADVRSLVGAVHGAPASPAPAPAVPAAAAAPVAPTAASAPSVDPPASEPPVFASPFTAQPDPQSVPTPASAPVVPPVRPRPGVVARPDTPSRVPPLPPRRRPGTGDDHD